MESAIQFFIKHFTELAEGFLDINLVQREWGVHLERRDSEDMVFSFSLSRTVDQYVKSINGVTHYVMQETEKEGDFEIWAREYSKEPFPFMDDAELQIGNFSFSDRKRNSRSMYNALEFLPGYMNIPAEKVKSFERIPRGLLHTSDARLWAVHDYDQQPITLALTITDKEATAILYLVSNSNFRNRGYGEALVRAILNGVGIGKTTYLVRERGQPSGKWLERLKFRRVLSFSLVE